MNKGVRFHDAALAELEAEALYYEARAEGLGKRFAGEVEAAIQIATEFPEMGSPFKYGSRRVFPRKFPFSIVYRIQPNEIVVLAIVPDAKKPGYWRDRKIDA